MCNKTILTLLAVLACSASAGAADFTGNIDLSGTVSDIKGNSAKLNEYRNIGSGMTLGFGADMNDEDLYLTVNGENISYNRDKEASLSDSHFSLSAGKYEFAKFSLFFDEVPHNFTYGARSYLINIDGNALLNQGNVSNLANAATWGSVFDYRVQRTNYGAALELSANSPFFFGVRADRSESKGHYPTAAETFTIVEFPAPIDYETSNLFLETGYRSDRVIFKVDGMLSQFTNANQYMTYQAPASSINTSISLPPDNTYQKVGGSLTVKLPCSTTLMARTNYSVLENDMIMTGLLPGTSQGKLTYTTASAALTTNPVKSLDARVFYNYVSKKNDSSLPTTYGGAETVKFGYDKNNGGLDFAYRLPAQTKVSAGYEFQLVDRSQDRVDATSTTDHIVFAELKNSFLESVTAKVRYQRLDRSAQDSRNVLVTSTSLNANQTRYDATDKIQDAVKVGLELEPMHNMSVGLEYAYKRNNYNKTTLGVKNDVQHEVNMETSYVISILKLSGTVDYEITERNSSFVNTDQVDAPPAYYWSTKRNDTSYGFSVNGDIDIIKNRLTAGVGWRYERANGSTDFSTNRALGDLQNIPENDDYKRQVISAKTTYKVCKNFDVSGIYNYEKLNYSDALLNNYQYVGSGSTYFLTGAYANPSHEAHTGIVKLSYKF